MKRHSYIFLNKKGVYKSVYEGIPLITRFKTPWLVI